MDLAIALRVLKMQLFRHFGQTIRVDTGYRSLVVSLNPKVRCDRRAAMATINAVIV